MRVTQLWYHYRPKNSINSYRDSHLENITISIVTYYNDISHYPYYRSALAIRRCIIITAVLMHFSWVLG